MPRQLQRIDAQVEDMYYDHMHPQTVATVTRIPLNQVNRQYAAIQERDEQTALRNRTVRNQSALATNLNRYAASPVYVGFHVHGFHQPKNCSLESTSDVTLSHMTTDADNKSLHGGVHPGIVQQGIV